ACPPIAPRARALGFVTGASRRDRHGRRPCGPPRRARRAVRAPADGGRRPLFLRPLLRRDRLPFRHQERHGRRDPPSGDRAPAPDTARRPARPPPFLPPPHPPRWPHPSRPSIRTATAFGCTSRAIASRRSAHISKGSWMTARPKVGPHRA